MQINVQDAVFIFGLQKNKLAEAKYYNHMQTQTLL